MSLLLAMAGIGGIRVNVPDLTVSDIRVGVNVTATYTLTNAGAITSATTAGGTVPRGNWINPPGAAGANYEVFITNTGTPVTTGTTGSWLPLNVTRAWTLSVTFIGNAQSDLALQIRNASTLVVLDTAAITLIAEKA